MNGLAGLTVRLDRPCCRCGSKLAVIAESQNQGVAPLQCLHCRQFRQRITPEVLRFLAGIVAAFGRPTEPITVFEQVNRLVT